MDEHGLYLHSRESCEPTEYMSPEYRKMVNGEIMKQIVIVVAALFAGFIGGIVGAHLPRAEQQSRLQPVVRARRFELVDEAGRPVSYWGIDKSDNAVLAFGSHWPSSSEESRDLVGHPRLALDDPNNQRVAIGVLDASPFLFFAAPDGKSRLRMDLSYYDKPRLFMEDETGARLLLGVRESDTPGPEDNDWVLDFFPQRAGIGIVAVRERGESYVRGFSYVSKDKVKYPDKQGSQPAPK